MILGILYGLILSFLLAYVLLAANITLTLLQFVALFLPSLVTAHYFYKLLNTPKL